MKIACRLCSAELSQTSIIGPSGVHRQLQLIESTCTLIPRLKQAHTVALENKMSRATLEIQTMKSVIRTIAEVVQASAEHDDVAMLLLACCSSSVCR